MKFQYTVTLINDVNICKHVRNSIHMDLFAYRQHAITTGKQGHLLAKYIFFGFDTAESEPRQVCGRIRACDHFVRDRFHPRSCFRRSSTTGPSSRAALSSRCSPQTSRATSPARNEAAALTCHLAPPLRGTVTIPIGGVMAKHTRTTRAEYPMTIR